MDGWGCGRELDGGGPAGAAATKWTEEPTAAICGCDGSRVASATIQMEHGFSRESLDGGSCGHEANAWYCGHKTDGRVCAL